jgi:hypothetical protein
MCPTRLRDALVKWRREHQELRAAKQGSAVSGLPTIREGGRSRGKPPAPFQWRGNRGRHEVGTRARQGRRHADARQPSYPHRQWRHQYAGLWLFAQAGRARCIGCVLGNTQAPASSGGSSKQHHFIFYIRTEMNAHRERNS